MTDHKMIDVIWFDSNRPLSPTEVTTFAEQGLAITQADITEPANTALFSAQLIVVTLSQSTEERVAVASRGGKQFGTDYCASRSQQL